MARLSDSNPGAEEEGGGRMCPIVTPDLGSDEEFGGGGCLYLKKIKCATSVKFTERERQRKKWMFIQRV